MLEYRDLLQKAYQKSLDTNESTSLRSFSKNLGISPSTLVRVLRKTRELPLAVAHQILPRLQLNTEESDRFMKSVLSSRKSIPTVRKKKILFSYKGNLQQNKHSEVITNHDMLNILALFSSQLPRTLQTVVDRLALSHTEAETLLKRLYHNGLIGFRNGEFFNIEEDYSTSDQVSSVVIRQSHLKLLDIAKNKLLSIPPDFRDFTSLKIPCRLENIDLAKKEIRKFQNKIYEILGTGSGAEHVVELAIQLFPQTKIGV